MEIASEYNLVLIKDGAQAIGTEYPSNKSGARCGAGSMGHFGCFSILSLQEPRRLW